MLTYEDMRKIWEEVSRVKVSEDLKFFLMHLVHNHLNNCIHGHKEYFSPEVMRSLCQNCRWKHEPCSEILQPLGERWWIDAIRLSKAKAYFEGRKEIDIDDLYFSIPYILAHRVHLREDILITYRSAELWAEKLVSRIKTEMEARWIPTLNGNKKALKDAERTLQFLYKEMKKDGKD